jgi:phosphatidylglycerol---prolipoprotein diacylglyceryl transferase
VALRLVPPSEPTSPLGRSTPRPTGVLQVASFGCDALADAGPQALGLSFWFDAAADGEPYPATIRFTGRRVAVGARPGRQDSFAVCETVERVVPGSGPVAVTTRIFDLAPGEWHSTATLLPPLRSLTGASRSTSTRRPGRPYAAASGMTAFAPVVRVRAPGARLGAWPGLVSAGVAVALTVQSLLAAQLQLPVTSTLVVSLIAAVVGLLGARLYYLAQHQPRHLLKPRALLTAGMCIQGFVLAAIATAAVGVLVVGTNVGRFLDATGPGLLLGMTIGRFGCFFGGCCAGRPTASRWGLWSSDRRVGVRRIPTQLLEAALALTLGLIGLITVLTTTARPAGVGFIGAMAAYTLGRQALLPWRDIPPNTAHGRTLTTAISALVLLAAVVVAVFK